MTTLTLMYAGETIPLSDSDENNDSDTESLDGIRRHENMHILRKAVSLYGINPDVIEAASRMLNCHEGSYVHLLSSCAHEFLHYT